MKRNREAERVEEGAMRKSLHSLIVIRLAVLSAILGLGIFVLRGEGESWNKPFFAMLGITALLSVVYRMAVKWGKSLRFQAIAQLVVDVGLATGIIHYTGGFASPFSLLYILIISAGSRFFLLRGTVLLALFCAAVHAAHLSTHLLLAGAGVFESVGPIPEFGPVGEGGKLLALQVSLYTITFVILAVLSGYLSVRVHRGGIALAAVRSRLRRQRLNTDQILRSLSSGLLTVDQGGNVVHFNHAAERITGIESSSVIGRRYDAVLEEVSPPLVTLLRGILSGWKELLRQETTLRSPAGGVLPIGMSASALKNEEGESAGVVCIFQDLTEVRRIEEHVRSVDRLAAVGELSSGIAHEIRNPLATISGSIQVLRAELAVEGENRRLLDLVVRESDRLHNIVEEFLDFARTGPTNRDRVNVNELITEIIGALPNHPRRGAGVEVRFEKPGIEYGLIGDEEQLRRVFLNLIVNAFDAVGKKGIVTVHIRPVDSFQASADDRPSEAIEITVRDTGPGVDPEMEKEIFRPFFTTKPGGVGLGLALAQKIVVSHGGKIDMRNDAKGTTFSVTLPREDSVSGPGSPDEEKSVEALAFSAALGAAEEKERG